jgi:hypothetical protein
MYQLIGKILHESNDFWHMTDEHMMFWSFGGVWTWLLIMAYGFALILLTVWTYQDAKSKEENATLWGIIIVFTLGVGILVYGLIRQPKPLTVNKTNDLSALKDTTLVKNSIYCENCGNVMKLNDLFCMKCGTAM